MLALKHGIYQVGVLAELDPVSFEIVDQLSSEIGLLAEHARVPVEEPLGILNNIVRPLFLEEFLSYMRRAHVGAIDLLLSETSLNSVVLQHVMSCLAINLVEHVLEGVVSLLCSGFTDPEGLTAVLDLLPLLLTVLLNVIDGVICKI